MSYLEKKTLRACVCLLKGRRLQVWAEMAGRRQVAGGDDGGSGGDAICVEMIMVMKMETKQLLQYPRKAENVAMRVKSSVKSHCCKEGKSSACRITISIYCSRGGEQGWRRGDEGSIGMSSKGGDEALCVPPIGHISDRSPRYPFRPSSRLSLSLTPCLL